MKIEIPKLSLVVLVGCSGSGKSTFARTHFLRTEVVSSDFCRGLVSDDENDQAATKDAFEVLHAIAGKRLERGRLTDIDATNVQPAARLPLVKLAREHDCIPVAIVLKLPEEVCHARNKERPDRQFGEHVVRNQNSQLRRSIKSLKKEGFRHIFVLKSLEEVEAALISRVPLWNDRRDERGPFDIIGDVHGCFDELEELLTDLGYEKSLRGEDGPVWGDVFYRHPAGRKAVFVGDLVDRGPKSLDVVRLVRNMIAEGTVMCVPGNHDVKFMRALQGKNVRLTHGLANTMAEVEALETSIKEETCRAMAKFIDGLVSHYVLDEGRLVVAHAGMKEKFQGRGSGRVREFALYGETTGETDEFGLPVRLNWAAEYRGSATVVYGHTPVPEAEWLTGTADIDTGCVFGGKLTAVRYPEREFVSVPSKETYCEPARPFLPDANGSGALGAQQLHDDLLDLEDVRGKRLISTRLMSNLTVREENATAALEVMSRYAANPKWLIYLPPTMSPTETSQVEGLLEHPSEAFTYYRNQGVPRVICEEKHMGSRAVVVLCRDERAARERFGGLEGERGIVYTRTGRRFFNDAALEAVFLDRLGIACDRAEFWDRFQTSWGCFDCELMPWSAKAQELLKSQYAAVGASGASALGAANGMLARAAARLEGEELATLEGLTALYRQREEAIGKFVDAYRRYCWTVESIDDLKLAPFHLLATEGMVHLDQTHAWHLETLSEICQHDPGILLATNSRFVDVTNEESIAEGIAWWTDMTSRGGEGMVVKPMEWIHRGKKGLVQPAVKCRGKEYLRIIYSPDYDSTENLPRLRSRGLGQKRSLALREFALGIEGLERFARGEPLRRVHECVFGVLALESEPVDPRL